MRWWGCLTATEASVSHWGSPLLTGLWGGGQEAAIPEGAPALCRGKTFCFQPEAQRGEGACLSLHSDMVTRVTFLSLVF